MTDSIWLTVAIPTLNAGATITRTLNGLVAQTLPAAHRSGQCVEYLVMDGGSTDDTLEIVERYSNRLPIRLEQDVGGGIYGALNAALSQSSSEYFAWLNADDYYPPMTLAHVLEATASDPDVVSGSAWVTDLGGRSTYYDAKFYSSFSPFNLCFGAPIPNARFFRRAVIDRLGHFDNRYRVAGDREWLWRFVDSTGELGFRSIRECLYVYVSHPGSLTFSGNFNSAAVQEYLAIAEVLRERANRPFRESAVLSAWSAWNEYLLGRRPLGPGLVLSLLFKLLGRSRAGVAAMTLGDSVNCPAAPPLQDST